MAAPMFLETLVEVAVERNARLAVRVRTLAAQLHRCQPGHDLLEPWTRCPHEECQKSADVLAEYGPRVDAHLTQPATRRPLAQAWAQAVRIQLGGNT